jgi:hypothetical protein
METSPERSGAGEGALSPERAELLRLLLEEQRRENVIESQVRATSADGRTLAIASQGQQRLWFLDRLTASGPAYHIAGAIELHGALDRAVLRRALVAVVARHEALRTVFEEIDSRVMQVIEADVRFTLRESALEVASAAERERRLSARLSRLSI